MTALECLPCSSSLRLSTSRYLMGDDSSALEDESWMIGGRIFLNYDPAHYNEMRSSKRGFQADNSLESEMALDPNPSKKRKTTSGIAPVPGPVNRLSLDNVFDAPSLTEVPPSFSVHLATELQNVPKFPDFFHYSSDDDIEHNRRRSGTKVKQEAVKATLDERPGSVAKSFIVPSSWSAMQDDHTGFTSRPPLAIPSTRTTMLSDHSGMTLKSAPGIPTSTTTMLDEHPGFVMQPSSGIPSSSTTMLLGSPGISLKVLSSPPTAPNSMMLDERSRFTLTPTSAIAPGAINLNERPRFIMKPANAVSSSPQDMNRPVAASVVTAADVTRLRNQDHSARFAVPSASPNRNLVQIPSKAIFANFGERQESAPSSTVTPGGLQRAGNASQRRGILTFSNSHSIPIHATTDARRFACSSCSARFTRRANLNRHQLVHTRDRPFKCPRCAQVFSLSGNLKRHLNNVHKEAQAPSSSF